MGKYMYQIAYVVKYQLVMIKVSVSQDGSTLLGHRRGNRLEIEWINHILHRSR